MAARALARPRDSYRAMGNRDLVEAFEAPDDAALTALSLTAARAANARTQTMRAFSRDEVNAIPAKVG